MDNPSPQDVAKLTRETLLGLLPQVTTMHTDKSHFYVSPKGFRYPSVTAKLQMFKGAGLMNFKMNEALRFIENNWHKLNASNLKDMLSEAKAAPDSIRDTAGDIGKEVHGLRELYFGQWLQHGVKPSFTISSTAQGKDYRIVSGCKAIDKFVSEHNYHPVLCEAYLVSDDWQVGGTLDDLGIVDGKLALIDLKTSNSGFQFNYLLQVAAYWQMLKNATGVVASEAYILHVSKDYGDYDLLPIKNIEGLVKGFEMALGLNALAESYTNPNKKKVITL